MGQKVNPHGLRVGVIKDWDAKWYANDKNFADNLIEDNQIRKFVKKSAFSAGISRIQIERAAKRVKINIKTAKPGMIIGKGGVMIKEISQAARKELETATEKKVYLELTVVTDPHWMEYV